MITIARKGLTETDKKRAQVPEKNPRSDKSDRRNTDIQTKKQQGTVRGVRKYRNDDGEEKTEGPVF